MNLSPDTKQQAAKIGRVGAVAAMAVLTLGTVDAEPVAGGQYVARAQTLDPQPITAQAATPIVKTEVVAEEAAPVAAAPTAKRSGGGGCGLDRIKMKESRGNYGAVSGSGKYRGAYQFDQRTWQSVGGSGDPAAASPAEQDSRAAALYARRGSAPWNC